MRGTIVSSARAELRLARAASWLAERGPAEPVLVVGATSEAAGDLVRDAARARGAAFGWHRTTLGRLAADLASRRLADARLAPAGALALEALCARVIDRLERADRLGRLAGVADRPGLPRALARSLRELRLAGARPEDAGELSAALAFYTDELADARLADRALVLELAALAAREERQPPLLGLPLLLLDVPIRSAAESALVATMARRAPRLLATVPAGDERTLAALAELGPIEPAPALPSTTVGRVQAGLFAIETAAPGTLGDDIELLSAPGESRECVEIARRILDEARRGTPFDRMAILLRQPAPYRAHLEEALARAGIPACFAEGTVRPDPAGRAFLALLGCAAEGLSARRFSEALSLGEVPDATPAGAPPPAWAAGDRWVAPDEELLPSPPPDGEPQAPEPPPSADAAPVAFGTLRAPWRWERLLVEAAVIGGRERWRRRLAGLERELRLAEAEATAGDSDSDEPERTRARRALDDLASLRDYAMPLLADLEALPARATWGEWLDRLAALATRALRRPERVLSVLSALQPMAAVGPIDLAEVRVVLRPRLTDMVVPPPDRRYGRVYVTAALAARGLAFDVVFVPGLAERMFPQKIAEDPLLLDSARAELGLPLERAADRLSEERLALRLAVGAARRRLVLSYPRVELDPARPRVPSFYGLEILRAAEGRLPGFDELARRAEETGAARIGWPAPPRREDAIDEAEHDLALLAELLRRPAGETIGMARFLLGANPHLARALRTRYRRWQSRWSSADGLIEPAAAARAVLDEHALGARSFSATALEAFAACPYRFFLKTIIRLEPRREPEPISEIDPLARGSLVHEIQFELLAALQEGGLLPITPDRLEAARARLEATIAAVAARYRDELNPAIERVWDDGVAGVKADLLEWLRRLSEERAWVPWRFELAFGLAGRHDAERDPTSRAEPVPLATGLLLRGSIDLVERRADGAVRATDHKTGVVRAQAGTVIGGGRTLQPVLYALALESLYPGQTVAGGRLSYCTSRGNFTDVVIPLDDRARGAAERLTRTIEQHLRDAFLPAAPAPDECRYCDYQPVCGPNEAHRVAKKRQDALAPLARLRGTP